MVINTNNINTAYAGKGFSPDIKFIKDVTDVISPEEIKYVADVKAVCDECDECGCCEDECEDILYVTKIMAFCNKFRVLHWSAANHSIHTIVDDFLKELDKYVDAVAENIQAINGQFKANDGRFLHIDLPVSENPLDILNELKMCVNNWFECHKDDVAYEGARNSTAAILEHLYKAVYLIRLAK